MYALGGWSRVNRERRERLSRAMRCRGNSNNDGHRKSACIAVIS
jgi:hypothetical protein